MTLTLILCFREDDPDLELSVLECLTNMAVLPDWHHLVTPLLPRLLATLTTPHPALRLQACVLSCEYFSSRIKNTFVRVRARSDAGSASFETDTYPDTIDTSLSDPYSIEFGSGSSQKCQSGSRRPLNPDPDPSYFFNTLKIIYCNGPDIYSKLFKLWQEIWELYKCTVPWYMAKIRQLN